MLPRLGDHTPIAYLPLQDEEGKTDLDFLLVVVDLPGNVNVHCAPLPWFLERKRATWSEGRLSGGKKKKQPFPQSCQQILAAEAFFSMKQEGFVSSKGLLSATARDPGRRKPPQGGGGTSPPTRARAGGHSSENQPRAGPPRLPRITWQSPNPTLCLLCLSLFWRQLAGLVERSPAEQMRPGYIMQIGCSEELISECL